MMPAIAASEPMPFRLLIDEAMKRTRLHFGEVYPAVAIPLAAVAGLSVAAQSLWMQGFVGSPAGSLDFGAMMQGCAGFLSAALLTITLTTLGNAAMLYSCVEAVSGRSVHSGASWRFVVSSKSLWTLFLTGLAVGAGFLLLVIPGIYFFLMLSFTFPVLAAEGQSGSNALKRSWGLVRYNPQRRFLTHTAVKVFVLYIIAAVLSYLVNALVQMPLAAVQGGSMLREVASSGRADPQRLLAGSLWLQVLTGVLASFVSTAVSVYTSFGVVLLYFDARRRKEGMDLEAALDSRAGAAPGVSPG